MPCAPYAHRDRRQLSLGQPFYRTIVYHSPSRDQALQYLFIQPMAPACIACRGGLIAAHLSERTRSLHTIAHTPPGIPSTKCMPLHHYTTTPPSCHPLP